MVGFKKYNSLDGEKKQDFVINSDCQRFQQVILNLVSNALKFSEKNSTVLLNVKIENNHLRVTVTDFGIGICQDDLKNLFSPF